MITRLLGGESKLVFEGYELSKAFAGVSSHTARLELPLLENDQDTQLLAQRARAALQSAGAAPAYLIRGHGAYTWGKDMTVALRHAEALEFLLACMLEERRIAR